MVKGRSAPMAKNLPNYYIILRVQPNASLETIKASYRKLMVTLKMHPDLGGDHDVASQINEAYAMLKDGARRAKYDRMYLLQRLEMAQAAAREREKRSANSAGARYTGSSTRRESPTPPVRESKGHCPFCDTSLPDRTVSGTRCERCLSPLGAPPKAGSFGKELFGRRATPRIPKRHFATVQLKGQAPSITVKMRDLSLSGLSFYADIDFETDQVFKFRDGTLEAVAVVVSRGKRGQWYSVHARLLTVAFHQVGLFVSMSQ